MMKSSGSYQSENLMRTLDNRKHISNTKRPKGADMDKPEGYIKVKLRRKWRRILNRGLDPKTIDVYIPPSTLDLWWD